jgi:hypothetical protein
MTEGELIDAGLTYYLNQGSSSVTRDDAQRRKAHFFSTQVAKRLWNSAPQWFRKADGQVQLSSGVGTMPSDFGQMGTQGRVYINGQLYRPLDYRPPDWMKFNISQSPQTGRPWAYSLYNTNASVAAQGLQEILCWPQDDSLLDVFAYDRKMIEVVDHPLAPAVATGAAGLLSGDYTYGATFVTARGETELGFVSDTVSPSSQQVEVSDLPTWWGRTVTSRKLYRNKAADPNVRYLVATISDNTTTSYTDNIADAALGAAAPGPSDAVSGLELFPEDFHESALFEGLQYMLARGHGDGRDDRFFAEWSRAVQRQWEEIQQGQSDVSAFPAFPGPGGGHPVWSYWSPPR